MANDKRDAETDLLIDIQKIIGADKPYEGVTLARYIESREAELRREIADELADIRASSSGLSRAVFAQSLRKYIEKLRGNK